MSTPTSRTISTNIAATTTADHVQDSRHTEVRTRTASRASQATYTVTALVGGVDRYEHAGSDSAGTTITVDNLSPGNVTSAAVTGGLARRRWLVDQSCRRRPGLHRLMLRRTTIRGDGHHAGQARPTTVGNDQIEHGRVRELSPTATRARIEPDERHDGRYYKIFAGTEQPSPPAGATPTGSPVTWR